MREKETKKQNNPYPWRRRYRKDTVPMKQEQDAVKVVKEQKKNVRKLTR